MINILLSRVKMAKRNFYIADRQILNMIKSRKTLKPNELANG